MKKTPRKGLTKKCGDKNYTIKIHVSSYGSFQGITITLTEIKKEVITEKEK
jgi:hypothetical protein